MDKVTVRHVHLILHVLALNGMGRDGINGCERLYAEKYVHVDRMVQVTRYYYCRLFRSHYRVRITFPLDFQNSVSALLNHGFEMLTATTATYLPCYDVS